MKSNLKPTSVPGPRAKQPLRWLVACLLSGALAGLVGCGTSKTEAKKNDFFTSGSREADQRASQRMARDEQLAGSGEGAGEGRSKKAVTAKPAFDGQGATGTNKAAQVDGKLALFDRLGGEKGITAIFDDFTPRVLQDPRVDWQRKGVKKSAFSFLRKTPESADWNATPGNIAILKWHLVQFIVLATGGPARYDGKEIKSAHAGMRIDNSEYDAVLGDLKASLDRLQIPNKEQKELLSIVESTRSQIVTQR